LRLCGDHSGWEDIKDLQSGTVERTITDDTQTGGPIERTIIYHAPFDRCNREQDYEEVWANFEKRFGENREDVNLEKLLHKLQDDFATIDICRGNSSHLELLVIKLQNIKIKIYQESHHSTPHIHIDYGKHTHTASYSIADGVAIIVYRYLSISRW
jgi:hypothetical protein